MRQAADVFHRPVLVDEVISFLAPRSGTIVDTCVGGAGHARAILQIPGFSGRLLGIDADPEAIASAREQLAGLANFELVYGNYANMAAIVLERNLAPVSGILMDLGVSYHQLTCAARGLSFDREGPLDMRFDQTARRPTALELIRRSSPEQLTGWLREYGQEPASARIGRRLRAARHEIRTTKDLSDIVRRSVRPDRARGTLARVFQALRIVVNSELDNVRAGLAAAVGLLVPGGRLVVISYHSLEDRLAKVALRDAERAGRMMILTRKPVRPSADETSENPQSRSARLRAGEKL